MSHYRSNLRDLQFNLFEVFDTADALGRGPFGDHDLESAQDILAQVEKLSVGPIAASYTDSDRTPPVYDPEKHLGSGPIPVGNGRSRGFRAPSYQGRERRVLSTPDR
jgi:hypothetical protein